MKKIVRSSHRCILVISLALTSVIILSYIPVFKHVFSTGTTIITNRSIANSPSFPNQEITDPVRDWIDMKNKSYTQDGDPSTDIASVDYYSDGKTLDVILWLYHPFQVNSSNLKNEEVNYGMYIDADFNERTGFEGIEYKFEIGWNNQSKKWTKILEKWSYSGGTMVLDNQNQTISYTNFSKKDAHYVRLSVDLDVMLSPEKYKAIFYGEVRRQGSLITDFTRMVAIPPLELDVSTSPNSIELRKGESKTIEVQVNTTQGYEPTVNLNATAQSKYIVLDFTKNDTSLNHDYTLRVPSYGIATIPLTISSTENATLGPQTIFIFANSSFPPEHLVKAKSIQKPNRDPLLPEGLTIENIFTQSSLLVTLQEPLTWIDYVSNFWDKLGEPLIFVTGIITGYIGPWVFGRVRERLKNRKNKESVRDFRDQ
jgi:hypothetical protein